MPKQQTVPLNPDGGIPRLYPTVFMTEEEAKAAGISKLRMERIRASGSPLCHNGQRVFILRTPKKKKTRP